MQTELRRGDAPWKSTSGLAGVLEGWLSDPSVGGSLTVDTTLAERAGAFVEIPAGLPERVRRAIESRGIAKLYSHQARAIELALAHKDFVVATPTASGKSLCFHAPVMAALGADPAARALYLYPTKALARDQEVGLRSLLGDAGIGGGAVAFDGDTPGDARRAARERSGVILTNPDMLHAGILPHHASWARLFAGLRYVVLDELHTYRGVFGSHLANVLRRLVRVARFHGSEPTFLFASATIGNPAEHAARMLGRHVELVGESGAPEGPRRVLVYNPPIVNAELGMRASYVKSAVRLTTDLVRAGVPTLVFGQSRNTVEVMLKYLRDRLAAEKISPDVVHAYRGGYLPETRRRIENQLRSGELRCVVATNALELGIDIGSLDAVVCAGYPGSSAALWQRFGRAGRKKGGSLALLVGSSAPLDQYVVAREERIVGVAAEHARIDPDNVEILVQHVKCAAFELPFREGDSFGNVADAAVYDVLGYLAKHEVLHEGSDAGTRVWHWASDSYPATHVSLRSVGWENFVVIDEENERAIAEMDFRAAHTMLHEHAIYQHEGEQFQVERLDFENHKAFVRKVAPDYYTDAMTYTQIRAIDPTDSAELATSSAGLGEISVVEKVVGYKKIKFHTHENAGYGDVNLPEMQMHTTAFWVTVPEPIVTRVMARASVGRADVIDALRGIASAMHTVACAGLMIDPRDLRRSVGDSAGDGPRKDGPPGLDPTIFLYDAAPGGVGLASRLFVEREEIVRRTREVVDGCSCVAGCPTCIGPVIGNLPGAIASHDADGGGNARRRVAKVIFEEALRFASH